MFSLARQAVYLVRRFRLLLWARRSRLRFRMHGFRLDIEIQHPIAFDALPRIELGEPGDGSGSSVILIGRGTHFGTGTVFECWNGENLITVGESCLVQNGCRFIARGGSIEIGRRTRISDGVWLKSNGTLTIGDDAVIRQYSAVACADRIEVGEGVGIAERVSLIDSDHVADGRHVHWAQEPPRRAPIELGRGCTIAAGAVILAGARLGAGCFVGANAVVRAGEYAPDSLLVGIPAEISRSLERVESA